MKTDLSNFTLPFIHPNIFYDGTYFYSKGGSIFIGSAQGSLFGITCKHATDQTDEKKHWQNLIIISKTGKKIIQPNNHFSLWEPPFQESGDLQDIMIFRYGKIADLKDHIPAYLDMNFSFPDAEKGDELHVLFYPKDEMDISTESESVNCPLYSATFFDDGVQESDNHLRCAKANLQLGSIVGMSGSLVWNITKNAPAGMVIRGGVFEQQVTIHYAPMSAISMVLRMYYAALCSGENL